MSVDKAAHRVAGVLHRRGLRGSARRFAELAATRVYLREEHIWFRLEADPTGRPHPLLAPGLALTEGDAVAALRLEPLIAFTHEEIERRLSDGGRVWLVRSRDELAFSCWTFARSTPTIAATGGWLELPEGVVCLEDSITAPAYRGRSIAPAAWAALADRLGSEASTIVTKVETHNEPSIRAVEKAGFRQIARMEYRRIGGAERVRVAPLVAGDSVAAELARRLER
jgi:ribosomal protein S18 acetylase RimI-like enzyme